MAKDGATGSLTEYLVGDWDGDGRDNLAVRRDNCALMDFNFGEGHNQMHCYGP